MSLCILVLLLLVCSNISTAQVVCPMNCVCLVPVLTSCDNPIQRLGGLGASLPEIVPGSFSQASFVTDLILDNNAPLMLHSTSFSGLTNITRLDLSDNAISTLPDGVFSTMSTLRSLDLSNNRLTSLNLGAFTGLVQLTTLILSRNQLTAVPVEELMTELPQLTSISLDGNSIDCDAENIASLVRWVRSGLVANGNQLECSNGTTVISLNITNDIIPTSTVSIATTSMTTTFVSMTTIPMTSSLILATTMSPSQVLQTSLELTPTPTTVSSTSSRLIGTTPISTPTVTPTPSVPVFCSEERRLLSSGYYDWSDTPVLKEALLSCPHGPEGGVARRNCMVSGQWGQVDDSECNDGSEATQLLADISEVPVTVESSELLSSQLSSLPPTLLSVQELNTVVALASQLLNVSGTNTQVLYNTLETFNTVLTASSDTLGELDTQTTNNIRQLIDTALINALSADNPELTVSFSHLAVGGAYFPATNHTHLLAAVKLSNDSVGLEVGGAISDDTSDVTIEVDGPIRVQVTVYDQDNLFNQSNCSDVMIVTPIISVVNDGGNVDNETVILSYKRVTSLAGGMTYVCVRLSTTEECSMSTGRWNVDDCVLTMTADDVLQCQCLNQGTFTLLTIPSVSSTEESPSPSGDEELSLSAKVVFYSLCSLAVLLYLAVIITILAHSTLRCLPILQLLVNLALCQALTSIFMMLSYELTSSRWVCYSLGVAVQYSILVCLSWMASLPIVVCIRVFKRLWYEKMWLIVPFILLCWVWPVIPVVVYNGLRNSSFPQQPTICWLESVVFPNTITYVCAFVCLVVIATIPVSFLLLCCSNYELESSTYYHLLGLFVNFVLFVAMVILQFFTAAASQFNINPFYLLLVTGGLMIICAAYFFAIYGLVQSKVRQVLLCSVQSRKTSPSDHNAGQSSGRTSQSSYRMKTRRAPTRITDEMNINYVDDYLGYPQQVPVSMAMLNQAQHGRVFRRTNDPRMNGVVVHNPMYSLSLTSDA